MNTLENTNSSPNTLKSHSVKHKVSGEDSLRNSRIHLKIISWDSQTRNCGSNSPYILMKR